MVSRITVSAFLGPVRFASVSDAPHVLEILNESMSKTFRIINSYEIVYLIENSILSICQLDDSDEIVGFLVLRDYPMIPSVHPGAWEEYIWTKYKAVEMNARNTLFVHLLCWSPLYNREMVDNMLSSVFMHDPYVHYIAMTKCMPQYPLLMPGVSRPEGSFRRVQSLERGVPGDKLPLLCVADRSEVCPRLKIRRAVEEDNDDIVPIIERHSERLTQIYGEFYISELISRHPESERVLLVCEHKELAVGVMCLNTQINYEALEENFELSPFAGLRHLICNPTQRTAAPSKDIDTLGSFMSSLNVTVGETSPAVTSNFLESLKRAKDGKTRVSWVKEEDVSKLNYDIITSLAQADDAPLTQLDVLSLLEDEEEEFEFDIINIDTANLRVPTILTTDTMIGPAESFLKMIDGKTTREMSDSKTKLRKKEQPKKTTGGTPTNYIRAEPMRYSGEPNAFLLELFAMHPDYDERHGFDILETAFELYPNRDYCIMCLPSNHPSFPLLEHFTLVTPYSSRARFINETLYVAHVNSVRCDLRVRPGEYQDLAALSDVLEHAPRINTLHELFESTLTSFTLQSFVFLSQNQPIGVVVLGPLVDCVEVRTQYDLEPEPRRPGTDCTILAGVISPALEPHARWYMRELLRQSQYSTLFWICKLFAKGDSAHPEDEACVLCWLRAKRIHKLNIYKPLHHAHEDHSHLMCVVCGRSLFIKTLGEEWEPENIVCLLQHQQMSSMNELCGICWDQARDLCSDLIEEVQEKAPGAPPEEHLKMPDIVLFRNAMKKKVAEDRRRQVLTEYQFLYSKGLLHLLNAKAIPLSWNIYLRGCSGQK